MAQNTPARGWFHSPWMSAGLLALGIAATGGLLFPSQAPPPQGPLFAMTSGDTDDPGPDPESAQKKGSEVASEPEPEPAPLPGLAAPVIPSPTPAGAPKTNWEQQLPDVVPSGPAGEDPPARGCSGPLRRFRRDFGEGYYRPGPGPGPQTRIHLRPCSCGPDSRLQGIPVPVAGRQRPPVWANRLAVDGLPAMTPRSRHLAVPTSHLPIPGCTMVWMIDKRTGGFTGWFATYWCVTSSGAHGWDSMTLLGVWRVMAQKTTLQIFASHRASRRPVPLDSHSPRSRPDPGPHQHETKLGRASSDIP